MFSTNILVLTFWPYKDALIQTYTLPYLEKIRKHLSADKSIWFQTLEKEMLSDELQLTIQQRLSQKGISWIPELYTRYGIISILRNSINLISLIFFCYRNKVKVIHVWCTPPGVKGYLLSLFTGAKLIIDSYEPHAEAMVENGTWKKRSLKFQLLFFFERMMSNRSKLVISATQGMKSYAYQKYGAEFESFYVKPACTDFNLFDLQRSKNEELLNKLNLEGKTVMLYAGKFGGIYLGREVFDLALVALKHFGADFMFLLLTSHKKEEIIEYCTQTGFPFERISMQFVAHDQIPDYIGLADFAVTPVKPVATKRYCTPIKDGEYWAMGLPIIITKDISDDSEIIEENNIGAVLTTLDLEAYQNAVEKIDLLLRTNRDQLKYRIREIAKKYRSFEIADSVYSKIYY